MSMRSMRFGEDGYFFVTDDRFTYLGHPIRRNLVGTSMTTQVDPNGDSSGLQSRYGAAAIPNGRDVNVRNFDGQPRLTEADARRNSPLFTLPNQGPWVLVSYGSNETIAFKQQSQDFLAAWRAKGFEGEYVDMPDTNHFDLALRLNQLDNPLVQRLLSLLV